MNKFNIKNKSLLLSQTILLYIFCLGYGLDIFVRFQPLKVFYIIIGMYLLAMIHLRFKWIILGFLGLLGSGFFWIARGIYVLVDNGEVSHFLILLTIGLMHFLFVSGLYFSLKFRDE